MLDSRLPARVRHDRRGSLCLCAKKAALAQAAASDTVDLQRGAGSVRRIRAGNKRQLYPLVVRACADDHARHALCPPAFCRKNGRAEFFLSACLCRVDRAGSAADRALYASGKPADDAVRKRRLCRTNRSGASEPSRRRVCVKCVPNAVRLCHAARWRRDAASHFEKAALYRRARARLRSRHHPVCRIYRRRRQIPALRQ